MPHAAMSANNVAVITGGASGIGLAAAMRFAGLGMKVCIADIGAGRLAEAATKLSSAAKGAADVMTATVDVSRFDDLAELESAVQKRFGGTDILMNNAGIPATALARWKTGSAFSRSTFGASSTARRRLRPT